MRLDPSLKSFGGAYSEEKIFSGMDVHKITITLVPWKTGSGFLWGLVST
jgi:hypothetical protein